MDPLAAVVPPLRSAGSISLSKTMTALSNAPRLGYSNSSITTKTINSTAVGLGSKEKIEQVALKDQTYVWTGYEQDVLPDKAQGRIVRNLRHKILYLYRRLFGVVFLANLSLLIAVAIKGANAAEIGKIVIANLFVSILMRQDYVIDVFFTLFCAVPPS